MPESKRLHISPLTPSLLPLVVPKAIVPFASNISYHTIQSSPERNYGYVTLPTMEADRIQKKLNGSILKGSKMRVGEARPEKSKRKLEDDGAEAAEAPASKKVRKEKTKLKGEEGVLPGVELPKQRKVKRGWTEPEAPVKSKRSSKVAKDKEKKPKSKPSSFTDKPELLFKTTVPPNAAPLQDEKKKSKKRKKGESGRNVIVHEFSNTTKQPAFLRDSQAVNGKKPTSEYVEGKGWVDEEGNVVEAESKTRRTRSNGNQRIAEAEITEKVKPPKKPKVEVPAIGLSTSTNTSPTLLHEDETSSSGSSSNSASDTDNDEARQAPPGTTSPLDASPSSSTPASPPQVSRLSITRSSATPPPINADPSPPPTSDPHPLEALFKRPRAAASASTPLKKPNLEVTTKFSFFDPDVEEAPLTGVGLLAPQTPFTRRDLNERGQRSAAPTPDTAMPGKSFWAREDDDGDVSGPEGMEGYHLPVLGEDLEEDGDSIGGEEAENKKDKGGEEEENAFAKEFWQNRGQNNRNTKRRMREAKKEKRRAENTKRGGRG